MGPIVQDFSPSVTLPYEFCDPTRAVQPARLKFLGTARPDGDTKDRFGGFARGCWGVLLLGTWGPQTSVGATMSRPLPGSRWGKETDATCYARGGTSVWG